MQVPCDAPLTGASFVRFFCCTRVRSLSRQVANAVCQVLSKIARIELPTGGFPELLPSLLTLVTDATIGPEGGAPPAEDSLSLHRKVYGRNALTCLAYLCEEHADIVEETGEDPAEVLSEAHCNNILTAVVQGECCPKNFGE